MPEILELKKSFGKFTALNSLSMNITDNSIFRGIVSTVFLAPMVREKQPQ